jgi:hypothetical protein
MIVAIIFAHVWGILQLTVLGSLARTVRIRTALAALAAGFYACAAAAVLFEIAWIIPTTWITGVPLSAVIRTASYTVDPFVEELVKIAPLVMLLLLVRVVRQQWSIIDCVIVSAALGSGFGLAEDLYLYGTVPANAVWTGGGWLVQANFATIVTIPHPLTTMTSWLPAGVAVRDVMSFFSRALYPVDPHVALSTIGGLAIGLLRQHGGSIRRRAGIILLVFSGLAHALYNAALNASHGGVFTDLYGAVQSMFFFLPVAALVAACWIDRQGHETQNVSDLALAAEKTTSPAVVGTLRTALSNAPWSVAWVDALVRMRRAYALERQESGAPVNLLHTLVVAFRDLIDRAAAQGVPSNVGGSWVRARFVGTLQQPRALIGLLIITPSILYFVVGGFPATAWLQGVLLSPPVWTIIRLLSVYALAWTAWNVGVSRRQWVQIAQWPLADGPATFVLRLLAGAGTLVLGGYAFFLSITRGSPHDHIINMHIAGTLSKLTPGLGQLLASSGPLLSEGIPPTLRTPYAPPGTPIPPPFNPDIPVVEPGPPGAGFPDPIPQGPVTLPSGTAAWTWTPATLAWLPAVAAAAAILTYSSTSIVSEGEEQRMLEKSRKMQQERDHH